MVTLIFCKFVKDVVLFHLVIREFLKFRPIIQYSASYFAVFLKELFHTAILNDHIENQKFGLSKKIAIKPLGP